MDFYNRGAYTVIVLYSLAVNRQNAEKKIHGQW